MSEVFLKIINMSISASWLVLAVLLLRLVLRKAPKWVSVLLWGFVAIRLICPFSIESTLSLIPSAETVSPEIMMDRTPEISTGIGSVDAVVNPIISESFAPKPYASANPLQILIPVASVVWIAGIAVMLIYTAISYILLRRRVAAAVVLRTNIYQSENVASPFVFGIVKPRIYLPFQIDGESLDHVVAHEESHIRRKDHLWKPVGFLLLSVYWFNPLMWLGYVLLCRDIELACDEKVIKDMDSATKADYTQALVACSVNRRRIAACPLAFGEVGVKERVKSVLHYKKPAFWIVVAAIVICGAVAVCFLTDPNTRVKQKLGVFIDCQIAGHFQTEESEGNACCVNWEVLGTKKRGTVTSVYMWVLYEEYSMHEGELYVETGTHIPTLITVKREDGEYKLIEYWEPRDGSFLEPGIREKFPWYLQNKALDSQRYIKSQHSENERMALEYFQSLSIIGGADKPTNIVITNSGGLLSGDNNSKMLSLNDVISLSQKGYELGWSDFEQYKYYETGSGLYIRVYEIDETFQVWIGSSAMPNQNDYPLYIYLSLTKDLNQKIDIRDGGVTEFIDKHSPVSQVGGADDSNVAEKWDLVPMIRVNSVLYLDTGYNSNATERTDHFDGVITSQVDSSEKPNKDDQSNFGTGYGYQYGPVEGTVELFLDGKWRIYATEEVRQQIQFPEQYDKLDDLDRAITNAVMEQNAGDRFTPDGLIKTESHDILGVISKSGTPLVGQTNHMEEVTVYIQYVYHRYSYSNGKPESVAGVSTPAMLTFSADPETGYALKEFWEPNGGSSYHEDIRSKFPQDIADMLLDTQSNEIDMEALESRCLSNAESSLADLTR